jgi:hypothetical protein
MKGKWEVTSNTINGRTMYAVYRLLDTEAVDHSGNREYAGAYVFDREACEKQAQALNERE